jgi:hypothetical protein
MELSDKAREARNAYGREYRRNNPDKIRKYNVDYWERKATGNQPDSIETKVIKLHNQGLSLREIASTVGIDHMKASRIIKKCNGCNTL